jgi:hypothetical protein
VLVPSPRLISQFPEPDAGENSNRSSWMGIGMARGPSIRVPSSAGGRRGIVDSFGTGFI